MVIITAQTLVECYRSRTFGKKTRAQGLAAMADDTGKGKATDNPGEICLRLGLRENGRQVLKGAGSGSK